jgi:hypothetical protein
MMNKLVNAAKQFGYSTLRLDTAEFMTAVIYPFQIFIEKKL